MRWLIIIVITAGVTDGAAMLCSAAQVSVGPGTPAASTPANAGSQSGSAQLPLQPVTTSGVTSAEAQRLQRSVDDLQKSVDSLKSGNPVKDWGPVVSGVFAALLAAIVAIYSVGKNTRVSLAQAERNLQMSAQALDRNMQMAKESLDRNLQMAALDLAEKAREEERAALRAQIDEFYAPFLQLRNTSKFLYWKAFIPRRTKVEKEKYDDSEGYFRTVVALVGGHKFEGVDLAILREIVDIGKRTAALIYNKIGLVVDPGLQELLGQATAHFRVMELGVEGEGLTGGGKEFEEFVFPRNLDSMVQTKLNELNDRLQQLQKPPLNHA